MILGVEGDFSWTSLAETRTVPTIGPGSFASMSAASDWLASLRGRLGFTGGCNSPFYLTGGAAWASTEYNGHMTRFIGAAEFMADAISSTTKTGWVLGGAERMVDPHVVVRLEYLYYHLDNNVALVGPISPGNFLSVTFTWSNYNPQVAYTSIDSGVSRTSCRLMRRKRGLA